MVQRVHSVAPSCLARRLKNRLNVSLYSAAILLFYVGTRQNPAAELNPAALPAVGHAQLRILSPTLLELTLITTKAPDPAPVTEWNFVDANYNLALPPASEFDVRVGSLSFAVKSIGFKRRPLYAPLKVRDLRIENSLYLVLGNPIPAGQNVSVKNPSGKLWDESKQFSSVAEPLRFNPAIHVNQSGYMPTGPKKAMVGYYLGSLGEMSVSAGPFTLSMLRPGRPISPEIWCGVLTRGLPTRLRLTNRFIKRTSAHYNHPESIGSMSQNSAPRSHFSLMKERPPLLPGRLLLACTINVVAAGMNSLIRGTNTESATQPQPKCRQCHTRPLTSNSLP